MNLTKISINIINMLVLTFFGSIEIQATQNTLNMTLDSLPKMDIVTKIVLKDNKILFKISDLQYPYIFILKEGNIKVNYVPVVWNYDSFNNIPPIWDIDDNYLWAINGAHIIAETFFCVGVSSNLFKIPLKDTSIWNHTRQLKNKDSLDRLSFSYMISPETLPIHTVFLEKYGIRAIEAKKNKLVNFIKIKDSLGINTYFNFLLSFKKEPIYFLLSDGELSIWKIVKDIDGYNYWQLERKYEVPRFMKFHCFEKNKELYILTDDGILYKAGAKILEKIKQVSVNFDEQILIIDKDNDQVSLLNKNNILSIESLQKTIQTKAINLF